MEQFLVFNTESDIDQALTLLNSKYKYQRLDGKWVTGKPDVIPSGLPSYDIEIEHLTWYDPNTKQFAILREIYLVKLSKEYNLIKEIYEDLKQEFTFELKMYGDSLVGYTQDILDSFTGVEHCIHMQALTLLEAAIDAIPCKPPFLTEERMAQYKTQLFSRISDAGIEIDNPDPNYIFAKDFNYIIHKNIDSLVHNISEDHYYEVIRGDNRIVSEIWWATENRLIKVREINYTRLDNKLHTITTIQYGSDGVAVETLTETIGRNNQGRITSKVGVRS